jgi:Dehydrogenases with different specificities (related to short-chain alcohol dehydrogenases)
MSSPAEKLPLALVTGAARRLGRAIALCLAKEGYAIGLHYHTSENSALETAAEIRSLGAPVQLFRADLARMEEIQTMFEQVACQPHPLQVLVNSAAVMGKGSLRDLQVAQWDDTMKLNLRAPFLCSQQAGRLMEHTGGVIINISDSGARKTWIGFPAYVVSKAGLEVLTRLLARTYAPQIRVNAVAPGLILPPEEIPEKDWQHLVDRVPVRKAGTPQDIAETVLFLIRNNYITGQTIVVDGGNQLI